MERIDAYQEAGADMIFPEAITTLQSYQQITNHTTLPVLANITEFGKTPLFTREELARVNIALILYPLSAFRAMNQAALHVYETIRHSGTQRDCLLTMQTRETLYDILGYHAYEDYLDKLFRQNEQGSE